MVARKRRHEEIEETHLDEPPPQQSLLSQIRSTWEFANLVQYIYIFGKVAKIDEDLDVEDLETACCQPGASKILSDIGLALLKMVSSHRGLTPDIFDEYTRRQYNARAPHRNPFGMDPEPNRFADFDVFLKLKVLVQLSRWTFNNADRIREKMEEHGELEQSRSWRINEIGYDRHERYYYALDDNRLYRLTQPPPPPASPELKSKKKAKKARPQPRSAKRRRTRQSEQEADDADIESDNPEESEDPPIPPPSQDADDFGGMQWECLAITLTEYQQFLDSMIKSRDPNEKALHKTILNDILPIIESTEASQLRKKQRQERELMNMQKLAGAKRSSRIEAKIEREKQDREILEAELKHKADLADAEAFQRKQEKMELDRESRMLTREQRIKEREMKRILHEQELAKMSEEEKKVDAGESRLSERKLKAEMAKRKQELAALEQEDDWTFDCSKCGKHGTNWDDGTHSVACERCNVWQHSVCLGISQTDAEQDDFHFVCETCTRREEDAKRPKIPSLKFRVGPSTSPPDQKPKNLLPAINGTGSGRTEPKPLSNRPTPALFQSTGAYNGPPVQTFRPPQASRGEVHAVGALNHVQQGQNRTHGSAGADVPMQQQHLNGLLQNTNQARVSNEYTNGNGPSQQARQPQQTMQNGHIGPASVTETTRPVNGYHGERSQFPAPSVAQAGAQNNAQSAWSARYIPPAAEQSPHTAHGSPPNHPSASPSRPGTQLPPRIPPSYSNGSHWQTSQAANGSVGTHDVPPPQTPNLNNTIRPAPSSATSHVNGFAIHTNSTAQLAGPPSISPVKLASPPHGHTAPFTIDSSATPLSRPPSFPADQVATSPGYSPVKHDSPKMQKGPLTSPQPGNVTPLPPVAKLAPTPRGPPPIMQPEEHSRTQVTGLSATPGPSHTNGSA